MFRQVSSPSLLSHLAAAIRAWWRQDRIRVSSREGRLLRLEPPCIVIVGEVTAELTRRVVGRNATATCVSYRGVTEHGCECELRVGMPAGEVVWTTGDETQTMSDEDVTVFQRRRA